MMIGLSEFQLSGFLCEDLCFYLQMLNDKMLKPNNENNFECKYQLKQITISRGKMLQLRKSVCFEK